MPNLKLNIPRPGFPRRIAGAPIFRHRSGLAIRAPRAAETCGADAETRGTDDAPIRCETAPPVRDEAAPLYEAAPRCGSASPRRGVARRRENGRRGVAPRGSGRRGSSKKTLPRSARKLAESLPPVRRETRSAPTVGRGFAARDVLLRKEPGAARIPLATARRAEIRADSPDAPDAESHAARDVESAAAIPVSRWTRGRFRYGERTGEPEARDVLTPAAEPSRGRELRLPARAAGAAGARSLFRARRPIDVESAPGEGGGRGNGAYTRSGERTAEPYAAQRGEGESRQAELRELRRIASLLNGIKPILREDRVLEIE